MPDPEFYPDFPCWKAPLRPGESPLPECRCAICVRLRARAPWVPVVISRDPYLGRLERGSR